MQKTKTKKKALDLKFWFPELKVYGIVTKVILLHKHKHTYVYTILQI